MSDLIKSVSSSGSDDEDDAASTAKKPKTQARQVHVEKFNRLKEKRLELKEKQAKKLAKKLGKRPAREQVDESVASDVQSNEANSGRFLPNISIRSLERKIDSALGVADIERAEKLSNVLFATESELKANRTREMLEFEQKREEAILDNKKKKKPRLNWKFDAKQRWESKSNM